MPLGTTLGMVSTGLGIAQQAGQMLGIGQKRQDRRQIEQQGKLQNQQIQGSKEMADYQQQKQMEMWNDTNYSAQVEHLKKAGLNPALIYGQGGGGGATVGGGSAGGVQGGTASTSAQAQQATNQGIQGGAQMAMLGAQMKLVEAQTRNVEADTIKKGVEPENITADTALKGQTKTESESRTKGQDLNNKWNEWLQTPDTSPMGGGQSPKEREFRVTINKTISEISKIDEELKKIGIDISKGKSEIERINADTNLKTQAYEQLQKLNPMEIQEVKKRLEMLLQDPANTEQAQWARMVLGFIGEIMGLGVKGAMTKSLLTPKKSGNINVHNWGEQ